MSGDDEIQSLVREGRYEDAAAVAERQGDLRRAISLYERVWRFDAAWPLAITLGDVALAVRLALDARDPVRARTIAAAVAATEVDTLRAAGETFARHSLLEDAALLFERTGDFNRAAALHERGGDLVAAGRARELAGDLNAAVATWERAASSRELDADTALARLHLGRLYARTGRPLDAARALQVAARHEQTRLPAWRALAGPLLALGHPEAAAEIARRLHAAVPGESDDPRVLARSESASSAANAPERFSIQRLLGAGSTGRVYQARDRLLGRDVALKVLSIGATRGEREALALFAREAEAIGRLRHPHVVGLLELDLAAGVLVFEYVPGGTLADELARGGPLPLARVRRIGLDLCGALAAAHASGVVHRDVKPTNVFLDAAGGAKLGDFGAAHLVDFGQTQTGGFIGTLAYMSPEQIAGNHVQPASDFYALGATLFEALTGRPPFLGPDLVAQHLGEPPPRPGDVAPALGEACDTVLVRLLAKDPAERFASADDLALALRAWPTTDASAPRRRITTGAPTAAATPADFDVVETVGRTARGRLDRARDPRVDRVVIVETLDDALDPAALARLRAQAVVGGPFIQRVLGADSARITWEHIEGTPTTRRALSASEESQLNEALAAVHENVAEAGLTTSGEAVVVRAAGGPVLLQVDHFQTTKT